MTQGEIQTDFRTIIPKTKTATDNFLRARWFAATDFGAPCKTTGRQSGIALDIASSDICGDSKAPSFSTHTIRFEHLIGPKRTFANIIYYLRSGTPTCHEHRRKDDAAYSN